MFYYIISTLIDFDVLLILAAVIPAIILMIVVNRLDKLEKEKPSMLLKMVLFGILSANLALLLEKIGDTVLCVFVSQEDKLYNILLYFLVVGLFEELSKYLLLHLGSWKSKEFNCQFDGVVYAVFVSLGFALWENISYVLHYGFSTALLRALTSVPGHACFGVFMGIFYGLARGYKAKGNRTAKNVCKLMALLIPTAIHGAYDYIITVESKFGDWIFIGFVLVMFTVSIILIKRMSKKDKYYPVETDEQ